MYLRSAVIKLKKQKKGIYDGMKKLATEGVLGYLPDERPTFWKLILYAIQQVIVMFPATITVALITGFQVYREYF